MNKDEWQKKGVGHRQRLRDKFLEHGLSSFTDTDVLELLLAIGTPRKDCKEAAKGLFDEFGSLAGALDASQIQLEQIKGVGPKNSFALHFIHGVAGRYLKQRLVAKKYLQSSKQVADFLTHSMRDLKKEILMVIFLDASHAIIDSDVLAEGTLSSNTIYPREIVKAALAHHAAAVVIAHNHPSGNRDPSEADRKLTRNLYLALSFMNIRLLDHFIVAGSAPPFSFADQGIMAEVQGECSRILQDI
jgi:DNA repair protein RadC